MAFLTAAGARLEYEWTGHNKHNSDAIVLLHEGLGSVSMWKDFPARLSRRLGAAVLVYSRRGHGRSERLPAPRKVSYLHEEALETLPCILEQLGISKPLLFGHSDGASIALIYAAESGRDVAGVIAMAPHLFVEEISIAGIRAARSAYRDTDLRARLARYHDDVDGCFMGWNNIWLAPEFRGWNIEGAVAKISCPVLAIQGHEDEYGTLAQIDRIAALAAHVQLLKLESCGHSPHRDNPERVLDAVSGFYNAR